MEHARTGHHYDHEQYCDPRIQGPGDDGVEARLADSTRQSKYGPDEVELECLRSGQERSKLPGDCMYNDVKPTSD